MVDEGWKLTKIVFSGLGSENKSFWHRKTHPDPLTRFPDRISRQIIDIPVRSYSLAIFGFDLGSWRDQNAIGWFRDHPTAIATQFCYRKTFSDPRLDQYQESWGDSRGWSWSDRNSSSNQGLAISKIPKLEQSIIQTLHVQSHVRIPPWAFGTVA